MITPIDFDMYDKITDDIMPIGRNAILKFSVSLGRKNEDGTKNSLYSEFMYTSNKYIDYDKLVTIKRNFDFFLSIESYFKDSTPKEFIMIRMQDMIILRSRLTEVYNWICGPLSSEIYAMNKGKLIMIKAVEPVRIVGLAQQKWVKFEPIIISYDEENRVEGVRMYLNSDLVYTELDSNNFLSLMYFIETFNMYSCATSLLAALGRPENGSNVIKFDNSIIGKNVSNTAEPGVNTKGKNTKVPTAKQKNKSFFDKMNDL